MNGQYTIRPVEPKDLEPFWQLRLKALKEHPDAFGSDYETSRRLGPSYEERGYFAGKVNRLFAAFTAEGTLVAQAGTYSESGKRSHIAHVVSVYTHPQHRRRGLAMLLVQKCIDHLATFDEITSVRISVNATNRPAIHVYEALCFRTWGEEPDALRAADGSCHNELHMVLISGARRS